MRRERVLQAARVKPPAVVLFSGNVEAIGMLRSLGRHRIPLIALDCNPKSSVLHSRLACCGTMPDPHHHEERFVQRLIDVGRQLPQKAVLFPTHDDHVDVLPRHADRLSEWFIMLQPSAERMLLIGDKAEQVKAAWRSGVATPATAFISGPADLAKAAEEVPFPAVLKAAVPLAFRRQTGLKVLPVRSANELGEAYQRVRGFGKLLLQEFVPGGDDELYNYGSYLDASSRPLAEFTRLKIRQHPRTFGEIRFGESVWVPEVADAGRRLLQELGYQGISGVEFKRDSRSGQYKLMEINARTTIISHTLAPKLDVDIPYVAYRDGIGKPITALRQLDGMRWIQVTTDVPDSVREILRGELGAGEWLRSLRGTGMDGIQALDDPLPGLLEIAGVIRRALGRALPRS